MKHVFFPLLFLLLSTVTAFAETTVVRPKVNHRSEPIGIENGTPVFRWNLEDTVCKTAQESYRITVAGSPELLANTPNLWADLWDSGWVRSNEVIEIEYGGKPLASSTKYFWNVEVKNNRGEVSKLGEPATFVTGILTDTDWKAKWISLDRTDTDPMPIFRRSFSIEKKVKNAYVHICGLGHYELRLNGQKVGQSFIDPGWTNYKKTCLYSSYDVAGMLNCGENVFGVLLGNGMYNVPGGRYVKFTGTFGPAKMVAQLEILYEDGTRETVASDETWKSTFGPIVFSCVYGGEDFDATQLQAGWDQPKFDDNSWNAAKIVDGPGGVLRAQEAPPIVVAETLNPESVSRLENGQYIADFGYNFSGRPRVLLRGKPGTRVTIKTGELIDRIWEGHSYTYTLSGSGKNLPLEKADDLPEETLELILPKFSYFGFQFLRIEGAVREEDRTDADQDKPTLIAVQADFTMSSAEKVGSFHCSNEMINEIDAMIDRSVRSNLQSVLTDCPHREKLGWLEVAHLMGPSIMGRYDVQNLYRKICRDTTESQLENGLVPDIAPEYTRFSAGFFESPEWGSSSVILPWMLSQIYGDQKIISQQYETMKRYTDYLATSRNEQGLVKAGLGDWYDWSPEKGHAGYSQHTPGELTATAMLITDAGILANVAINKAESDQYQKLASQAVEDYKRAYLAPDGSVKDDASQATMAFSIALGITTDQSSQWALINRMKKDHFAPTTGEVAFRYLLESLDEANSNDIIWNIMTRTEKPGYGYMLKHCGMKTLSETWDGPGSSMNHCMFGHAQEWFTQKILGINFVPHDGKYKLTPTPLGDLTSAEGYWQSPLGKVESSWSIVNERFKYRVVIPPNMQCELKLPTTEADFNFIRLSVDSGTYEFETEWKKR